MLAKYALFVNSILVLVLGCVMVAMSMVTRLQREEISLFESIDMDPVYFVLGMGAFVVFISLLGCLGALRESVWTLHFFCICVMMIFLLEIVTFVFALTLMSNIQGNITHSISKGIKQYGLNQKKDAVLDDLQQKCPWTSYMQGTRFLLPPTSHYSMWITMEFATNKSQYCISCTSLSDHQRC
ncbi:tetraspanin-33 isoform X6 [Octopus sinensis]|uniref:Tetraspanin-33 isoform X6 n=1 Tax=Octopus sinensis TaxID=2607531 RepID=A0A7E6F3E0_9MOLL|nr:tetraspanin-33 isoform X6 [Octopus sinensis]